MTKKPPEVWNAILSGNPEDIKRRAKAGGRASAKKRKRKREEAEIKEAEALEIQNIIKRDAKVNEESPTTLPGVEGGDQLSYEEGVLRDSLRMAEDAEAEFEQPIDNVDRNAINKRNTQTGLDWNADDAARKIAMAAQAADREKNKAELEVKVQEFNKIIKEQFPLFDDDLEEKK